MNIKIKSYSSQSSLISSIVSFIVGGILFTYAEEVEKIILTSIGVIFGAIAIIAFLIAFINQKREIPSKANIAIGIVTLVIAIIFVFFSQIAAQFIRFIIGGWILFYGILRFIDSFGYQKTRRFLPLFITSIIFILIGIYTVVAGIGDFILKALGIIIMLYSTIDIISYVLYNKEEKIEEEGTTKIIIPDNNTEVLDIRKKKKTKIKDIKDEE